METQSNNNRIITDKELEILDKLNNHREYHLAYNRLYYLANKDHLMETASNRYAMNREAICQSNGEYNKRNRAKISERRRVAEQLKRDYKSFLKILL